MTSGSSIDLVIRVLTNLKRWLADREFVATKDCTAAGILMTHVLAAGAEHATPYHGNAIVNADVKAEPSAPHPRAHSAPASRSE